MMQHVCLGKGKRRNLGAVYLPYHACLALALDTRKVHHSRLHLRFLKDLHLHGKEQA